MIKLGCNTYAEFKTQVNAIGRPQLVIAGLIGGAGGTFVGIATYPHLGIAVIVSESGSSGHPEVTTDFPQAVPNTSPNVETV